jgi:hypothetical protein
MSLNPVERRLALLCGDWIDFRSDAAKRLLVWQVPANAIRLVQCFLEAQKHALEYSSGDVFVTLQTPFEHSTQYSRELKAGLRGQYDASREQLVEQKLESDWTFDPAAEPHSAPSFMDGLRSFGSKYHKTIGHLVGVLMPLSVSDGAAFSAWVMRALAARPPERLRLLVVDSIEDSRFPELTSKADPRISVQRPSIDALSTAQETFAQEPTAGPAGVFRNLLMGVVALIEKGSADHVKVKATDALAFARKQGWADQDVAVRILVAGALLKEARHREAITVYQVARQSAKRAVAAGHPAGQKLVLQTWFGEAAAHLAAGDAGAAATCYDEAAIAAQRDRNAILAIEAFRMSGFCHARMGDAETAIERGVLALDIGESMKPDVRPMTTLPIAAVDVLRAADAPQVTALEHSKAALEAKLTEALQRAERSGAELETDAEPPPYDAIDATLERERAEAYAETERDVTAIVAAANPAFREHFERGRRLLGVGWPMQIALAVRAVPEPAPLEASTP